VGVNDGDADGDGDGDGVGSSGGGVATGKRADDNVSPAAATMKTIVTANRATVKRPRLVS